MAAKWELTGTYFEACNCDAACPCIFLNDPTKGECTVVLAWHIDQGKANGVALDGLNFAAAYHTPGNMMKTKWTAAVYVDEKAKPAQRKELEQVISGTAGGIFGVLAPLVGKLLGLKYVAIDYRSDGKHRSLRIPGIAEVHVAAMDGAGGAEIHISGAPLSLAPTLTVAKSEKVSLHDHGWNWEFSGLNSFYAPYTYQGP